MSTKAPPRGAICGRSYLAEYTAIDLIAGLRDTVCLLNQCFQTVPTESIAAGRLVRAENAVLRVLRELEDALGSSADE